MARFEQLPAKLDVVGSLGDDLTVRVDVVDDGVPVDVSGWTFEGTGVTVTHDAGGFRLTWPTGSSARRAWSVQRTTAPVRTLLAGGLWVSAGATSSVTSDTAWTLVLEDGGPVELQLEFGSVDLSGLQTRDEKGQPGGYAGLDAEGKVPTGQLPAASGLNPSGVWDALTTYEAGDLVTHAGSSWVAQGTTVGTEPGTDPAVWQELVVEMDATGLATETYVDSVASELGRGEPLAADLLDIHTYDDDPSLTHPSVVFAPEGWNGYRWWMAFTPWPGGQREHASICASHDGQTWVSPEGMGQDNRIFPTSTLTYSGFGMSHGSDTHLLRVGDELWCYHRMARSGPSWENVVLQKSSDGVNWTEPTEVLRRDVDGPHELLSPAVELDVDGNFVMWVAVAQDIPKNYTMARLTSTDGETWSTPVACTLPSRISAWHHDVKRVGGTWYMLLNSRSGAHGSYYGLSLLTSDDGLDWKGDLRPPIEHHPYVRRYYRSAFIPRPGGPLRWDVWVAIVPDDAIPAGGGEGNPWRIAFYGAVDLAEYARNERGRWRDAAARLGDYVGGDLFNRADDDTGLGVASSGHSWEAALGTIGIIDGAAYAPGNNNSVSVADWGVSDCIVEAIFDTVNNQPHEQWIVVRRAAGEYLRIGRTATVTNPDQTYSNVRVQKIAGGVVTPLGIAVDYRNGQTIGVKLDGENITVMVDGRPLMTVSDSLNVAATRHGVQTANDGARFPAFSVRRLP